MSRRAKSKSVHGNHREMKNPEEIQENSCVVCFKGVDTYSIGQCDHPVCFECSTRMRVLCKQNECPICRQEMPLVYFTKTVKPFKKLISSNILSDKKYKIEFENESVMNAYLKLLEHTCPKCPEKTFDAFYQLQDHVRRVHQLNYCDLCVENLKIFTFERRIYSRHELVNHRRAGDADDKSHKGHPICEFCDIRYMDSDELFRHLRRDHLFCHFCDADGYHQYYNSYGGLRDHFSQKHYLCEEGECSDEQFTSVFRSEIDLKAHKTTAHGRMMSKVGLKQTRTLELEFTLAPRQRSSRSRNHHSREEEEVLVMPVEEIEQISHQVGINTDCIEEFPCLGGGNAQPPANSTGTGRLMIGAQRVPFRNRNNFSVNDENFPVLGNPPATAAPSPTVNVTVSSGPPPNRPTKSTAAVSIQLRSGKQPQLRKEDFPALSHSSNFYPVLSQASNFPSLVSNASTSSTANPQWTEPKPKPVPQPQSKPPPKPTFSMDSSQFPTLGNGELSISTASKKSKNKKKTVNNQQQPSSSPRQPAPSEPSDPKPAKSEKSKKKQKDPDKSEVKLDNKSKVENKNENNKQKSKKQENKADSKQQKSKKERNMTVDNRIETEGEANNNIVRNGDSLGLITEEFMKLPPPGFGPAPPPGFGRLKPPPGLPPPGFSHHYYLSPKNFIKRNKKLITEVIASVGEEYYEQFKKFSGMFRSDVVSAEDYIERCSGMMGQTAFDSLFPELLALLPDINKQQELWGAMDSTMKRCLEMCAMCGQVLTKGDAPDHSAHHAANLDNQNFPPLPLPLT